MELDFTNESEFKVVDSVEESPSSTVTPSLIDVENIKQSSPLKSKPVSSLKKSKSETVVNANVAQNLENINIKNENFATSTVKKPQNESPGMEIHKNVKNSEVKTIPNDTSKKITKSEIKTNTINVEINETIKNSENTPESDVNESKTSYEHEKNIGINSTQEKKTIPNEKEKGSPIELIVIDSVSNSNDKICEVKSQEEKITSINELVDQSRNESKEIKSNIADVPVAKDSNVENKNTSNKNIIEYESKLAFIGLDNIFTEIQEKKRVLKSLEELLPKKIETEQFFKKHFKSNVAKKTLIVGFFSTKELFSDIFKQLFSDVYQIKISCIDYDIDENSNFLDKSVLEIVTKTEFEITPLQEALKAHYPGIKTIKINESVLNKDFRNMDSVTDTILRYQALNDKALFTKDTEIMPLENFVYATGNFDNIDESCLLNAIPNSVFVITVPSYSSAHNISKAFIQFRKTIHVSEFLKNHKTFEINGQKIIIERLYSIKNIESLKEKIRIVRKDLTELQSIEDKFLKEKDDIIGIFNYCLPKIQTESKLQSLHSETNKDIMTLKNDLLILHKRSPNSKKLVRGKLLLKKKLAFLKIYSSLLDNKIDEARKYSEAVGHYFLLLLQIPPVTERNSKFYNYLIKLKDDNFILNKNIGSDKFDFEIDISPDFEIPQHFLEKVKTSTSFHHDSNDRSKRSSISSKSSKDHVKSKSDDKWKSLTLSEISRKVTNEKAHHRMNKEKEYGNKSSSKDNSIKRKSVECNKNESNIPVKKTKNTKSNSKYENTEENSSKIATVIGTKRRQGLPGPPKNRDNVSVPDLPENVNETAMKGALDVLLKMSENVKK